MKYIDFSQGRSWLKNISINPEIIYFLFVTMELFGNTKGVN